MRQPSAHRAAAAPLGVAAVAAAAVLAACGTPSPDLFVVERTGTIPGARLTLRVQDGGQVSCNGKEAGMMASDQLIDAREIVRELGGGAIDRQNDVTSDSGPLDRNLTLAPQPNSILRYSLRAEEGRVAFSDTSKGQPEVFAKVVRLVRGLAKGVCKLPR
ncbi:MAG: hypothetical protein JWP18_2395 [Solirubrobacterales bacterium]|jgi:hypothetical protein|nr:hypothetical protein [Solirubrobacterales bacterium]